MIQDSVHYVDISPGSCRKVKYGVSVTVVLIDRFIGYHRKNNGRILVKSSFKWRSALVVHGKNIRPVFKQNGNGIDSSSFDGQVKRRFAVNVANCHIRPV